MRTKMQMNVWIMKGEKNVAGYGKPLIILTTKRENLGLANKTYCIVAKTDPLQIFGGDFH